jgi:hypothetical protein
VKIEQALQKAKRILEDPVSHAHNTEPITFINFNNDWKFIRPKHLKDWMTPFTPEELISKFNPTP